MTTKKINKNDFLDAGILLEKEVGILTFGMFLRSVRDLLGLTQEKMAKKLNVTKSSICDIEKGRHLVSPKMAKKIAKKVGLAESFAIKLCLQDLLNRDHINMTIEDLVKKSGSAQAARIKVKA